MCTAVINIISYLISSHVGCLFYQAGIDYTQGDKNKRMTLTICKFKLG